MKHSILLFFTILLAACNFSGNSESIEEQLLKESLKDYEFLSKNGDIVDQIVSAGQVVESYRRLKDDENFKKWKTVVQDLKTKQEKIAQDCIKGERLFYAQSCASCHKLNKKLVGPALSKISQRRDKDWIKKFIVNNASLRASGDTAAINIYEQYNGAVMNAFPYLNDSELEILISYMDNCSD